MSKKEFVRRNKEDKPVLAICYDFDKTLSPYDMQEQGYIQSVGKEVGEFWKESNGLAENNEMDQNLAYMFNACADGLYLCADGVACPWIAGYTCQ